MTVTVFDTSVIHKPNMSFFTVIRKSYRDEQPLRVPN